MSRCATRHAALDIEVMRAPIMLTVICGAKDNDIVDMLRLSLQIVTKLRKSQYQNVSSAVIKGRHPDNSDVHRGCCRRPQLAIPLQCAPTSANSDSSGLRGMHLTPLVLGR